MRVIHLSYSDDDGGAFRAAYRIHQCLQFAEVQSKFWVTRAVSNDASITASSDFYAGAIAKLRHRVVGQLNHLHATRNSSLHSFAVLDSNWPEKLNATDADVVHLHWINNEMMSIRDISRIKKPIVWTLHDMWAFCGAEHYAESDRWIKGYSKENRPPEETGLDLNRWTWNRKRQYWKAPLRLVSPSRWLAHCVSQSALLNGHNVSVVPYPIDTKKWSPTEATETRRQLNLSPLKHVVVYVAMGGARDKIKGFELLIKALSTPVLEKFKTEFQIVVIGKNAASNLPATCFDIHYAGRITNDDVLRKYYCSADAVVIPSRLDNLPNVGIEAQACGALTVAFDVGGLGDLVDHCVTGYLARPLDTADLAAGLVWALYNSRSGNARLLARQRALQLYSNERVASAYKVIYQEVIDDSKKALINA